MTAAIVWAAPLVLALAAMLWGWQPCAGCATVADDCHCHLTAATLYVSISSPDAELNGQIATITFRACGPTLPTNGLITQYWAGTLTTAHHTLNFFFYCLQPLGSNNYALAVDCDNSFRTGLCDTAGTGMGTASESSSTCSPLAVHFATFTNLCGLGSDVTPTVSS